MFRKRILSAVLAAGALSALASPAGANPSGEFHHRRFEVLVACSHRWELRGNSRHLFEAEQAAQHLRQEGFRVEIREC